MDQTPEAPAEDQGTGLWTFANVQFDERSLELRVAGQPVEMERKSLEVLRQLLYRAGEVATKDELLEAVWPGRILSETVLAKCISRIRQVLGDDDQQIVKTVHGYGYRLIADVKVQVARSTLPPPKLALNAGDSPPLRPEWKLVKRLGAGGQGEVWLCRHEKLGSQRVLKFALEESGLAAIKREITLHRLLRDTLGERADLCNVIDWNLKEPPFFIELEFAEGGNLEEWAAAQGGLTAVPLATRLDIVVRIADILAATHSVGVLHKDLKPTNVLMGALNGAPQPKLTDFGSGGLMDPLRLEALGITRMGFTKSVFAGNAEATPLYRAPELMTGQPATVQADIFSLGVMLYQVVVGDLRRPLAPGWENDVEDPLLREDIALAVAGDRGHRLTDVAAIATRLRTLEERRAQREREKDAEARLAVEKALAENRARQAELALTRLKARRNWMLSTVSVLIVGMALSVGLWVDARRARNEAREAAASSQAVADFLSKDLFAVVGQKPLRDLTVAELLESAAQRLDERANDLPNVSAKLHTALGESLFAVEHFASAKSQIAKALTQFERAGELGSEAALLAARYLPTAGETPAQSRAELPRYEDILARGRDQLGPDHPAVVDLGLRIAAAHFHLAGNWLLGTEELRTLVGYTGDSTKVSFQGLSMQAQLGWMLTQLGEFDQAEVVLRNASKLLDTKAGAPALERAVTKEYLARTLIERESFDEAERLSRDAEVLIRSWTASDTTLHMASLRLLTGILRLRQGRSIEATEVLEDALKSALRSEAVRMQDTLWEWRQWLSLAYRDAGRFDDSVRTMRKALELAEQYRGPSNPVAQLIRIDYAEVLLSSGKLADSRKVLHEFDPAVLNLIGKDHPSQASLHRVKGLTALAEGANPDAHRELAEALRIYELRFGAGHSFTRRARAELARAQGK